MSPIRTLFYIAIAAMAAACGRGGSGSKETIPATADTITSCAGLLDIVRHEGYTEATISDPWRPGHALARLALVPRNSAAPDVPDGYTAVVRVPLERSVVFSSVHTAPVFELGCGSAINAVADGRWFPPADTVARLLAEGRMQDIGSSSAPSVERILALGADAVLLSPMQDSDNAAMQRAGITAIPMADYMERTPLARAEWIKLLGELYGAPAEADSIYKAVAAAYDSIRTAASEAGQRPKVLTETLTSGVWYVPGGTSYMASMLTDAGADYPWSDTDADGSLALDASAVLDRASDADIWLLRCFGGVPTYEDLARDNPAARHISAFGKRNIYVCDTSAKNIFNDIAFHPERILRDFAIIFHPGIAEGETTAYFEKI